MATELEQLREAVAAQERQVRRARAEVDNAEGHLANLRKTLAEKEAEAARASSPAIRAAERLVTVDSAMDCGTVVRVGELYVKHARLRTPDELARLLRMEIAEAIDAARRDAFEQAAKQCELYAEGDRLSDGRYCAGCIRSLK
jgi:hypothetical protein